MAETTYTYDITADMPGGAVNTSRLKDEIGASSIATALRRIDTDGGTLSSGVLTGGTMQIVFADALSGADKTTFDGNTTGPAGGLLAAHDNSADLPEFKETSSTAESSTTSGTFSEKLTLAMKLPVGGLNLLLEWYYEMRVDDGDNRGVEVRVQLDDSTVLAMEEHIGIVSVGILGTPIGIVRCGGGFVIGTQTAGNHHVDIDFRRSRSAGTAFIRRARLSLRRLGD